MSALDGVRSIARPSLHEELVARLQDMIVEGSLAPGEKVPERELCERFGVSRTPMREALKVLAAEGLLVLEPNRGARVRTVTLAELEEAFPLMGAFEALAGELACRHVTEAQLARVREAHARMLDCHAARDLQGYFRHNQRIHELIMVASGNALLGTMYRSLAVRVRRARYLANMDEARWQAAVDEHERMLEALEARDGAGLAAILKAHLANKFATVRDWLESEADRSP